MTYNLQADLKKTKRRAYFMAFFCIAMGLLSVAFELLGSRP